MYTEKWLRQYILQYVYFTTMFKERKRKEFKLHNYPSLRTHSTCHTHLIPGDLIRMLSSMCTQHPLLRAKRRCLLQSPTSARILVWKMRLVHLVGAGGSRAPPSISAENFLSVGYVEQNEDDEYLLG